MASYIIGAGIAELLSNAPVPAPPPRGIKCKEGSDEENLLR